jgi:hypothetical protein
METLSGRQEAFKQVVSKHADPQYLIFLQETWRIYAHVEPSEWIL